MQYTINTLEKYVSRNKLHYHRGCHGSSNSNMVNTFTFKMWYQHLITFNLCTCKSIMRKESKRLLELFRVWDIVLYRVLQVLCKWYIPKYYKYRIFIWGSEWAGDLQWVSFTAIDGIHFTIQNKISSYLPPL